MFAAKQKQFPVDLSFSGEIIVDQRRMNDIARRVEDRLRFMRDQTLVPLVHDFSELCSKYGADIAEELVAPVERAILKCGWVPARHEEISPEGCHSQIVATKLNPPSELNADLQIDQASIKDNERRIRMLLRLDQNRMNQIASHVEERLRRAARWRDTLVPLVSDYSGLCSSWGADIAKELVAPVEKAIAKCGWIPAEHLERSPKACRLQIVATNPSPRPDTEWLDAELLRDQWRMNDIASRVEARLRRFQRHNTVVPLVHDYSELCSKYGDESAEILVAPVKEAIIEAGWIPTKQVEDSAKAARTQIAARRP